MKNDISGVILAGGENRRFEGLIKSNSTVGGVRIIDRILSTISDVFAEIIIVTNTPDQFSDFGDCKIIGDYIKGIGPLGGIHAAMMNSSKKAIFVFAGDMPFLSHKLILRQTGIFYRNICDAVIPFWNKEVEPLHGIYMCSLLAELEAHIKSTKDYNIRRFLDKINVAFYKPGVTAEITKAFININTPDEAAEADRLTR